MHGRVALAAIVTALVGAGPAAADIPTGNLIVNPGAEAAAGASDAGTTVPVPGWTIEGNFTAAQYNEAAGFPTPAQSASWTGGVNFFAGGPDSAGSAATQSIAVAGAAPEIDAGGVTLALLALLGGYAGQEDAATLTVTALDAGGTALGTTTLPPVTAAERNQETKLLGRSATAPVPRGTRSLTVRLAATRASGSYNDGYLDNLSLTLSGAAPPVFNQTVVVEPVSGTVKVRPPGSRTFVTLTGADDIPMGSTVDTRRGRVRLASVPRAGGPVQSAEFYDGLFVVRQRGGITELTLSEALARCPRRGSAAAKPKSRKLWGDGRGSFRTRGKYSAATVRGTKWLVQDTCAGTLTRVTQGSVTVRDFRARRTVVVRNGKRYLARAR